MSRRLGVWLALAGCQCAPQTSSADLVVEVRWPGASADEVMDVVVGSLEVEISHIPGLVQMVSTSDYGSATIYLRFEGEGDGSQVIAASRQRLAQLHEHLPDGAEGLRAYVARPTVSWTGALAGVPLATGALASRGVGVADRTRAVDVDVWTVQPRRLREFVVSPLDVVRAVDLALAADEPIGPTLSIPSLTPSADPVQLQDVAQLTRSTPGVVAWNDDSRAAILQVDAGVPVEGWTRVQDVGLGGTCAVASSVGWEQPPVGGLWIRDGSRWFGRGVPTDHPALLAPGVWSWPCQGAPPMRIALVAAAGDVDVRVAEESLRGHPDVLAVIPVAVTARTPSLSVDVSAEKASALGLTVLDVTRALSWSGQPRPGNERVVLRLPELEPEQYMALPVHNTVTGSYVPLSAVASLSLTAADPAQVRVNGQRAVLVDVVATTGSAPLRWVPPSDVRLLSLDGFGPQSVGP
ncbi:MAG: efflux RND transporter permease subunit [Myxococcota bacterium]